MKPEAKPSAANGLNTGIARTKGGVDGFDIIADCTLRDVQPTCKFGSGQKTGAVFQNMEELSLTVRRLYRFGRLSIAASGYILFVALSKRENQKFSDDAKCCGDKESGLIASGDSL